MLIAGGGVAALETLLALRDLAEDRIAIELVAPEEAFAFRPLQVGGPFALGNTRRYSLPAIAATRGARFRCDALKRVYADERCATTQSGDRVTYDALVLAIGAELVEAVPGALTYTGSAQAPAMRHILAEVAAARVSSLAFVVPPGDVWPLPAYELALMTALHARRSGMDPAVTVVSAEQAPLAVFGRAAAEEVGRLLVERGVTFRGSTHARRFDGGSLLLSPGSATLRTDVAVALPRSAGRLITGVPHTPDGFVRTDLHGRVSGVERVWAAGDGADFPIKQGGLAAQQADAVAEDIAALAGAAILPESFRPVLRGMLLTGEEPRYLRATIAGGAGEDSVAADHALWWPPTKIAGRWLGTYLGAVHDDVVVSRPADAVPVEVELEREWAQAHPEPQC